MTFASRFFSLFPAFHILLTILSIYFFVKSPTLTSLFFIPTAIYLFPLVCFRILVFIRPIREGSTDILSKNFSPWWAGHQIQTLFISIPSLEAILKIIPGAFSLWLRFWGSRVGKNVYWTPGSIHYDRNLLEIGDNVVFGERSLSVCHVISPKDQTAILTIAKIRIGPSAFIGAASVLSPGVTIDPSAFIKAGQRVYPNQHIKADKSHE